MHSRSASADRTGTLRSVAGLALGLGWWALAVSGCGAPVPVTSAPPSSRHSPSPLPAGLSSSPTGTEAPAGRPAPAAVERVRVDAAYRRFWSVSVTVSGRSPGEWRKVLSAVATEPLLSHLVEGFADQRARSRVDYGVVVARPTVVALEGGRASVVDCQDASRSGERDLDSGLPLTVGSARTPVAAVVRWVPGRGWLVSEARYVQGSC
jgi:hypothetical protein